MWRHFSLKALKFGLAAGGLFVAGCATPETRISEHPDLYHSLSSSDQALVTQGQIRPGMSRNAVWLAWGTADQKIPASVRGRPAETWVYLRYETPPSYGGPYYYGPFDWSYIPPKFIYPIRAVTLSNGSVAYFGYLAPP